MRIFLLGLEDDRMHVDEFEDHSVGELGRTSLKQLIIDINKFNEGGEGDEGEEHGNQKRSIRRSKTFLFEV